VLLDLEELTERELDRFKDCYEQIAGSAREDLRRGSPTPARRRSSSLLLRRVPNAV
jgi:hypothetical protein